MPAAPHARRRSRRRTRPVSCRWWKPTDRSNGHQHRGHVKRRELRPQKGQQQSQPEDRSAGQHRVTRAETIGNASRIDAEQQRKQRVGGDQRADQEGIGAEVYGEQRSDHPAAHVAALDDQRDQGDQVYGMHVRRNAAAPRHWPCAMQISYHGLNSDASATDKAASVSLPLRGALEYSKRRLNRNSTEGCSGRL